MTLRQAFGFVLRKRRVEAGISQQSLAEVAEIDRTYVSLLERGVRQPSLESIFRIAYALECPPDELVRGVMEVSSADKEGGLSTKSRKNREK